MIIRQDGPLCSCKNRGCLEALASRWAIERDIKQEIKKGRRTSLQLRRGGGAQIKSKALKQALRSGDKVTTRVITNACDALGSACVSLRHIFDPQMIILGGGVIEACGDFMIPRIKRAVDEDPFFTHLPSCEVVASELGDEAVIMGAVALVKDKLIFHSENRGVNYPFFYFKKGHQIMMDEQPLRENVYIKSDGTVRKLDGRAEFDEFCKSHVLDDGAVKKICKNAPRFLIIGTHSRHLELTEDAKQYLIKKSIKAQILPVKESVSVYNALPGQKAFLVHVK
jgi:glucokinase